MTIGQIRSLLYGSARFLGDVNAVKRKRMPQRIGRRLVGKATGRLIGGLFK